jgi:hypothetical protein
MGWLPLGCDLYHARIGDTCAAPYPKIAPERSPRRTSRPGVPCKEKPGVCFGPGHADPIEPHRTKGRGSGASDRFLRLGVGYFGRIRPLQPPSLVSPTPKPPSLRSGTRRASIDAASDIIRLSVLNRTLRGSGNGKPLTIDQMDSIGWKTIGAAVSRPPSCRARPALSDQSRDGHRACQQRATNSSSSRREVCGCLWTRLTVRWGHRKREPRFAQ